MDRSNARLRLPRDARARRRLVADLLRWFRHSARDLPWRRTRDPYAIWVSEVMLQQTQVSTVIPYWERWMAELPNLPALAEAPADRVLKLWEGLGYYARARNLQQAARRVCRSSEGRFPRELRALQELPGIGRYTAGAIASIAYNQPAAVVDGNVTRVLCRLFALGGDPKRARLQARLWALADTLVMEATRHPAPGRFACADWNQSLMELGATFCLPRGPRCSECPARRQCRALARDAVARFPRRARRPPPRRRGLVVFLVMRRGRFLVRRRRQGGTNGGLWEFPSVESLRIRRGPAPRTRGEPVLQLRHAITRTQWEVQVYRRTTLRAASGDRWVTPTRLGHLAFAGLHRKIIRRLELDRDFRGGAVLQVPEPRSPKTRLK